MTTVRTPVEYRYGGKYRFQLTADLVVDLNKGLRGYHILRDGATSWAILDRDKLTIFAGYAFDGCSPAWKILGKWYGTPTPRRAVAAAAVHDCLRGYLGLGCVGYTRKDTDDIFFDMLQAEGFLGSEIYHGAVAGFCGSLYIRLTAARPSKANCKCHGDHHRAPIDYHPLLTPP